MQLTTTTVTATLLSLLPLALAAPQPPIAPRQYPGAPPYPNSSEILPTTIISHDLAGTWPPAPNVCLYPPNDIPSAHRRAAPGAPEQGRSLLYTFTYPPAAAGRQCWLEFATTQPVTVRPDPGAQLDVFGSWAPARCDAGAAGNNRDGHFGRLNVVVGGGGVATWAATYTTHLTAKGPCAAPGTVEGIELVAVGDGSEVAVPHGAGKGLRIRFE
ncbi:hypothetical protein VTK26DRAFT_9088 [Humicola hyalothermophila]